MLSAVNRSFNAPEGTKGAKCEHSSSAGACSLGCSLGLYVVAIGTSSCSRSFAASTLVFASIFGFARWSGACRSRAVVSCTLHVKMLRCTLDAALHVGSRAA